jgi:hypothetical protein
VAVRFQPLQRCGHVHHVVEYQQIRHQVVVFEVLVQISKKVGARTRAP